MYPRWVLHLIDAVIVFFTIDIISSVGIIVAPFFYSTISILYLSHHCVAIFSYTSSRYWYQCFSSAVCRTCS